MTAPQTMASPVPPPGLAISHRVIGLDLSLAGTGIAGATWAETIAPGPLAKDATRAQQWHRLKVLRGHVAKHIDHADLVVLEAMIPSNLPGVRERAFLWWWTVGRCLAREIPFAEVQPSTLKVYATGDGRATKEDMVQQLQRRRPELAFRGNDQADASWLCTLGHDWLGEPLVQLPQTHRRALTSVRWPSRTP